MKKKSIVIFSTILLILSMATMAFADFEIKLNPLAEEYSFTSFPQTMNITGKASNPDEAAAEIQLYINENPYGDSVTVPAQKNNVPFSIPWTITEPGTYKVKVTLIKKNPNRDHYAEDTETVLISAQVTADYPAAPAIAAKLLKEASIQAKYGKNGNYISDVAQLMGQEATFPVLKADKTIDRYVSKSDVVNYENAVRAYLEGRGLKLK
ncbi:hypothetical protein [Bacillus sp. FJAT-27245]|uniref:hypothetical protein n=1 Tax=Bacillus sp. FJAT-27245 TaxID=1684144 RepID=UPI0006A78996|nr:hypothetical protein [Bacillus sp. FJAT-27245]